MLEKLYFSRSDAVELNAEEDTRSVGGKRRREEATSVLTSVPGKDPHDIQGTRREKESERERERKCVYVCLWTCVRDSTGKIRW